MKYALFDLDGTLWKNMFILEFPMNHPKDWEVEFMYSKERISVHAKRIVESYSRTKDYESLVLDFNSFMAKSYEGKTRSGFRSDVEQYVQTEKGQKSTELSQWSSELLRKLIIQEYKLIVVTGGPDVLAEFFIDYFKAHTGIEFDGYLSTEYELSKDEKYTGRIKYLCHGVNKLNSIKEQLEEIDLDNSIAFGDSISDVEMLGAVGNGYLISDKKIKIVQHDNLLKNF